MCCRKEDRDEKTKSCYGAFFDNTTGLIKEKGYIGSILIKVISRNEDESDQDNEEDEDTSNYTGQQLTVSASS